MTVTMLAAFYAHLLLRVDVRLFYEVHPFFPGFALTPSFVGRHLAYPGGPVEYVSAFLAQYCYVPWAGALVLTAIATLLSLFARALLASVNGRPVPLVPHLPAVLLMVTFGRYGYHLAAFVGLLVVLAVATIYVSLPLRSAALRFVLFATFCVPLYYVVGGSFLVFPVLCATHEVYSRKHRLLGLLSLLMAEVVPQFVGRHACNLETTDAFWRLLPFHPKSDVVAAPIALAAVLAAPAAAVIVGMIRAARESRLTSSTGKEEPRAEDSSRSRTQPRLRGNVLVCLGAAAAAGVVFASFDGLAHARFQIARDALHGRWSTVLEEASRLDKDRYTYAVSHNVSLALYHLGQLPESMFAYPQNTASLMVAGEPGSGLSRAMRLEGYMELADTESALGLVNEAACWAFEALGKYGERPLILKRLARLNLAKGEVALARKFLGVLRTHPLEGRQAARLLEQLDQDPTLASDQELREVRARMLPRAAGNQFVPLRARLRQLLEHNPDNRMALEFLLALHLLRGRPGEVAARLPQLEAHGYDRLPRHYQEALLVNQRETGLPLELGRYRLSEETRRRFETFAESMAAAARGPDLRSHWDSLEETHGDTYFFYYYVSKLGGLF